MQAVRSLDCLWKCLVLGHGTEPCFWKGLPFVVLMESTNRFHLSLGARLAGNVSLHKASVSGPGCLEAAGKGKGCPARPLCHFLLVASLNDVIAGRTRPVKVCCWQEGPFLCLG